mmetsp:Transcript_18335/g.23635  ORF Transcript_18335/g.23635 Transcript_18335/m.23635 type:complete len:102 (+) Transcript_18335:2-307(+)
MNIGLRNEKSSKKLLTTESEYGTGGDNHSFRIATEVDGLQLDSDTTVVQLDESLGKNGEIENLPQAELYYAQYVGKKDGIPIADSIRLADIQIATPLDPVI